jgi:hypothetical protein
MTLASFAVAATVLVVGLGATPPPVGAITQSPGHGSLMAVALAFPVAMALATGVEAPSSAIVQLVQLDDAGRRQFGRVTLWLTLGIVGTITVGLAVEAHHLRIGIPHAETTQIAELARVAAPGPIFAGFQLVTALLLLSAASSSFQAGPGLLKALARHEDHRGQTIGILPGGLGRTNAHLTPYWGVALFTTVSGVVVAAAGARDQELVLFYAVSVFLSFLAGLLAMAVFSRRNGSGCSLVLNLVGAAVVAFTLVINLARGMPLVSLGAALLVAAVLHRTWVRAGRPGGIRDLAAQAEEEPAGDLGG